MSFASMLQQRIRKTQNVELKRAVNTLIRTPVPRFPHGSVLLAHTYYHKTTGKPVIPDPQGWWKSEKYDGYRAIWTGTKFISRNGNEFMAPSWFKQLMPSTVPMDGELWVGRQSFELMGGIRRKVPKDEVWVHVQYLVFDLPTVSQPFEIRKDLIEILATTLSVYASQCRTHLPTSVQKKLPTRWTPVKAVHHAKVKSRAQLEKDLTAIVKKGGEGLMIRQPGSLYEKKRSKTLLKLKKAFDAECRITGYKPGAGKYKGRLGAFQCVLVSNPQIHFNLSGMTDAIRTNYKTTHPVGTIVTFVYNEISPKGVPRFPRYLRIRAAE